MYQRIHSPRYWGKPLLLEEPDKWSLTLALKTALAGAGATTIAILGRQLIRIWKVSKDRELAFYEKFSSDLMVQNAALSVRLDTAQDHSTLAVKRCAEMYTEQLKEMSRLYHEQVRENQEQRLEIQQLRQELRAREAESYLIGRRKSGNGTD